MSELKKEFEGLTNKELLIKIDNAKRLIYNIESEIRHREDAATKEKYKDIIGKYFYNKTDNNILKILKVKTEPSICYICQKIQFIDTSGTNLLQTYYTKSLYVNYEYEVDTTLLNVYIEISEDEAYKILEDKWKKSINRITFASKYI